MLTFKDWWERSGQHYERAVIEAAAGGTPWPLDPEKRAANAKLLGLPEDTDPMGLRRALWERRYSRPAPPAGLNPAPTTKETAA
ncbi:hypothetical protein EHH44_19260 [Mycolicibacter terrae]|uniref:Uncharacterized protein n=1 Tax=Mycolicibacter terrae TaxID=1788 RepID=A0ACD2EIF9_9MYCO|nr:hypothetical protein [Mycolicibacter terrae]RRR41154.1 hypothetical protein EHH44_19260 [Mycolicibacter terrae]